MPKSKPVKKTDKKPGKRLSVDLTPRQEDRLSRLQDLIEASSQQDVVRKALQLCEYLAVRTAKGYRFKVQEPGGEEVAIDFFEFAPTEPTS